MRALRRFGRKLVQKILIGVGGRFNYFLIRGIDNPANRFDHRVFLAGTRWWVATDVVRNATVELLAREVRDGRVPGAVAEVGVYQGHFAAILNHHFPDRTLYLFDTFEGFRSEDVRADRKRVHTRFFDDFSDTSIEQVRSRMPHPEKVALRMGAFPDSGRGCENERFCLVSLDVDLYQPTREALRWFYPRVEPGGFILVHDYNNDKYRGVKEAVREFAAELGVTPLPLTDLGGTVVIAKPRVSGRAGGTAAAAHCADESRA